LPKVAESKGGRKVNAGGDMLGIEILRGLTTPNGLIVDPTAKRRGAAENNGGVKGVRANTLWEEGEDAKKGKGERSFNPEKKEISSIDCKRGRVIKEKNTKKNNHEGEEKEINVLQDSKTPADNGEGEGAGRGKRNRG